MKYFALPYLVSFDDTMAYGSHHYLTNFKFQCAAREALLFGNIVPDQREWREELKDILMLTRDGYSRNLNPVPVGEKALVLMTFEEPTLSSIRLCFRTLRYDGAPVACGYQSIVCVGSNGKGVVELPAAFTQFSTDLEEPLTEPDFRKRALEGGHWLNSLFPEHAASLARELCSAPASEAYPQMIESQFEETA